MVALVPVHVHDRVARVAIDLQGIRAAEAAHLPPAVAKMTKVTTAHVATVEEAAAMARRSGTLSGVGFSLVPAYFNRKEKHNVH